MIPQFRMFQSLGMYNNYAGLLIPHLLPFGLYVVLYKTFFDRILTELIDAARIDGVGEFTIFTRIMIPLSSPIFVVVAIYTFLSNVVDFFWAWLIVRDVKLWTMNVALYNISRTSHTSVPTDFLMGATVSHDSSCDCNHAAPRIKDSVCSHEQWIKGVLPDDERRSKYTNFLEFLATCDLVAVLRKSLEQSRDILVIQVPTNTYNLTDDRLDKQFLHISNNDSGLKAVAFHLCYRRGLTIDGQGSTLLVHGKLIPFLIENCREITLRNFILDWKTDYHAELLVEKSDRDGTIFRVLNNCAVMFMDGRVYFDDYPDNVSIEGYHLHLLEYDAQKLVPAEKANDFFLKGTYRMEPVAADMFRVEGLSGDTFQPGRLFIATNHVRPAPGIVVTDSSKVNIEDVTIHYAPGMAILAQRSADVTLKRVTVKRNASRRISALADASHFVMCQGNIHISECDFSGQLDDAANVHGIYGVIHKIIDDHTVVLALQHYQQLGILLGNACDNVRFLRFPEHLTLGENQIKHIRCINERFQQITFADPIPAGLLAGDIFENLTLCPNLTIVRCNFVDNRAWHSHYHPRQSIGYTNNILQSWLCHPHIRRCNRLV